MMKRFCRNQEGYILAYVLVVVLVVSIVAVAATTTAYRNNQEQKDALAYTRDKYSVEGAMERFVAELQADINTLSDKIPKGKYSGIVASLEAEISSFLLGDEDNSGIVHEIQVNPDAPAYEIEVKGEALPDDEETGFIYYTYTDSNGEPALSSDKGYFPVEITATISRNGIQVEAVLNFFFDAIVSKEGNPQYRAYTIDETSFAYSSYRVTTAAEGEGE